MIKNFTSIITLLLLVGCSSSKNNIDYKSIQGSYVNQISTENLKTHLTVIASDEMEGRNTGSEGQKKAGKYMIEEYKKVNISHPSIAKDYYQPVPATFINAKRNLNIPDSENIWAFIEGSDKKDEIVVLTSHYDHVGIKNGEIYNGADDDGSGTVALMEIARVFQKAKEEGKGPRRSILILHVTAEELGLHGSRYYTENPLFPLENTVSCVNIDMIGRRDDLNKDSSNYVYVIGSDYLSSDLHSICQSANQFSNLKLDYKYNDKNDRNRFYYRSDHYNFAKNGIPSVFLFSGVHEDYHKTTDDVEKIEFDALTNRTKYAFSIVWEIANRENKLIVDKTDK